MQRLWEGFSLKTHHYPKDIPEEARKRLEALDSKPHIPMKFSFASGTLYSTIADIRGEFSVNYKATAISEEVALKRLILALRSVADMLEVEGFPYKEVVA
jgi:hypothetical protein